jgi:hypothetical protein
MVTYISGQKSRNIIDLSDEEYQTHKHRVRHLLPEEQDDYEKPAKSETAEVAKGDDPKPKLTEPKLTDAGWAARLKVPWNSAAKLARAVKTMDDAMALREAEEAGDARESVLKAVDDRIEELAGG